MFLFACRIAKKPKAREKLFEKMKKIVAAVNPINDNPEDTSINGSTRISGTVVDIHHLFGFLEAMYDREQRAEKEEQEKQEEYIKMYGDLED